MTCGADHGVLAYPYDSTKCYAARGGEHGETEEYSNDWETRCERAEAEVARLTALLNMPEVDSFLAAVVREAAHQRERWGAEQDDGKTPEDWFWLLGFLGGKALRAHSHGDREKALHHTISSAAALANWHAVLLGKTNMRPGIMTPEGETP
jgi:hypothetical protein